MTNKQLSLNEKEVKMMLGLLEFAIEHTEEGTLRSLVELSYTIRQQTGVTYP